MALRTKHDHAGLRYIKTACLTAAFFALGNCIALLGPAIPTLAYNLSIEVEDMSFIFTARGCGYLVGSLLCALLFKKMSGYLLIGICLVLTGLGNFAVPFMPSVILIGVAALIAGTSMGILDTAGNVMCLGIWGTESEPWIQALHFSFAFGAMLAPLLAKPFIRESAALSNNTESEETTVTYGMGMNGSVPLEATEEHFPRVAWAFITVASLCMVISVTFCFLSFSKRTQTESEQENTIKLEGRTYRLKIIVLLFMFYFLYVGTEVTFGVYIYSFAINCEQHYSKSTGTLLNSLFWGTFAVGRFFAIFFTKCISPKKMLVLDLIGTTVATVIMSFFPYYAENAEWILWAATALYGWSMASLFPTGITWAEHYITVTEKAATTFVVGAALGEMVLPFIMGYMIAKNPMNLMFFCAVSTGLCILNFFFLLKVAGKQGSRLNLTKKSDDSEMIEKEYKPVPTSDIDADENHDQSL